MLCPGTPMACPYGPFSHSLVSVRYVARLREFRAYRTLTHAALIDR